MKICLWGNVGEALRGRTNGGGELQIALLAKALARAGNNVVVFDYVCGEEFQTEDGINVYPIKGWNRGIRIIRTLTHRIPQLYLSMRNQKADIYYCRIKDFRHIFVWLAARKVKAKFILGLASDLEIMNIRTRLKYYLTTNFRNSWIFFEGIFSGIVYPLLLKKSDFIFVQHEEQKQLLHQKGTKSIIFPNLVDLTRLPDISNPSGDYFAYVGWLNRRKGVIEFFKLAEKAPSHKFKVIGPPRDKTGHLYYEKLKSLPNVSLLGELEHADTLHMIANSKALISTSLMEGFPNIFIEAWAYGIPVLSLNVDPGSVIKKEGLGVIAHGDIDKILGALDNIKVNGDISRKVKAHVDNNYALNTKRIKEINKLFNDLYGNRVTGII